MMAKCPHCNAQLQITESYDIQYEKKQYRDKVYGICPDCETEYQWEEIFVYQGFEKLEEI